MTTYLKDLVHYIGRYGGHLKKIWVKGFLDTQVVSLLSAEFLASKDGAKHHMLNDL